MVVQAPVRDLLRMPKVDLHVHLEGSIRPSTLREIAARNGRALPSGLRADRYTMKNVPDFFVQYAAVRACLHRPEDYRRIAYEFCQAEAAQEVRYAEVTFTVEAHGPRLGDWDLPVRAVLEGFAQAQADCGLRCQLVLDHSRRRPLELA